MRDYYESRRFWRAYLIGSAVALVLIAVVLWVVK